jgi:hypothetical protein
MRTKLRRFLMFMSPTYRAVSLMIRRQKREHLRRQQREFSVLLAEMSSRRSENSGHVSDKAGWPA